jgi:hypothetical protein
VKEGLRLAGYDIAPEELADAHSFAELLGRPPSTLPSLLIWSRPLISAALVNGSLKALRGRANLIEVSVDGLAPPAGGDEMRVIVLAGWRGQPFHPGWKRVLAGLEKICAPRTLLKPAAHGALAKRDLTGRNFFNRWGLAHWRKGYALPAAAALLAATGIAAQRAIPDSPRTHPHPPVAARTSEKSSIQAPGPPPGVRIAQPSPPVRPEPESNEKSQPRPSGPRKRAVALVGAAPTPSAKTKQANDEAFGSPKRYSRKNSKVMRLFCQRVGQSTPECRSFSRAIRKQRT